MVVAQAGHDREAALDGLRAIAILAVVAYHGRVPGFDGGFAGVDVFFALSGFLITSILLREHAATGRISLIRFYARRARRLVPALTLALLGTVAISWLVIQETPTRRSVASGAIATSAFVQNVYLMLRTGDYFNPDAVNPLLHMWSLSVEEQFYLVWPLLLLLALGVGAKHPAPRSVALVGGVVTLGSLATVVSHGADPLLAFYSPWSRAWELGVGALLACWAGRANSVALPVSGTLGFVGIAAVVISVISLDATMVFAPWRLLAPVFGAAAVVASVITDRTSAVARLLATRPMVWIGERSYGWYLWHFPAITLGEYLFPDARIVLLLCVATSLGVAHLSYRYVELPVRRQEFVPIAGTHRTFVAAAAAILLTCTAGFAGRQVTAPVRQQETFEWTARQCPGLTRAQYEDRHECELGSDTSNSRVLLWGDSHAAAFAPLLDTLGKTLGFRVALRRRNSCPPLLGFRTLAIARTLECRSFNDSVFSAIGRGDGHFDLVVLAARWTEAFGALPRDSSRRHPMVRQRAEWDTRSREVLATRSVRQTIAALDAAGQRVLVIEQVPEWRHSPDDCARYPAGACLDSRQELEAFRRVSHDALLSAVQERRAWILDFLPLFCAGSTCRPERNGVVEYADFNHLSASGAQRLIQDARCAFEVLLAHRTLAAAGCPFVLDSSAHASP